VCKGFAFISARFCTQCFRPPDAAPAEEPIRRGSDHRRGAAERARRTNGGTALSPIGRGGRKPAAHLGEKANAMEEYGRIVALIERLHRRFLDVMKVELDRLGVEDINNVQAFLLINIGEEQVTVSELTARGYYLGSNVSYNLKKLVDHEYLEQERSARDRRVIRVRLTDKGRSLWQRLSQTFDRQAEELRRNVDSTVPWTDVADGLRVLERFWSERLDFRR
jgi:DNA-binding MarR family transcriptional regulator